MSKATTPSFITEIPLKVSSKDQAILKKRFWAAKQQYNALLGECLKRLDAMRADKRCKQAQQLYKQKNNKTQAKSLFRKLAKEHGYRKYDLSPYCRQWNTKSTPFR